jgi:hypothetical protein
MEICSRRTWEKFELTDGLQDQMEKLVNNAGADSSS